jgi:hypothetical protein
MNYKTAAVVNVSPERYNLATHKIHDWLSCQGVKCSIRDPSEELTGNDLIVLSCLFSWTVPKAVEIANKYKGQSDVWCGGPGVTSVSDYYRQQTGLECHVGLDWRFERQRGCYEQVFASRGCPMGCSFCIVPKIEGRKMLLDWDFVPAPILNDNNISALPVDFQEHIVNKYEAAGGKIVDAQNGFDPGLFNEDTYRRWKDVLKGPWRLGLDETKETGRALSMLNILKHLPAAKKRVYVLIGNEPMEDCVARAYRVIENGGEPHCQPYKPLDYLGLEPIVPNYDWTLQAMTDVARYFNRWLWRKLPLSEYAPRKNQQSIFKDYSWAKVLPRRVLC